MSRFLVGITGGLASGKSTLVRRLGEAGFHVIDADRVVADLYAPGGAGAQALADLLGPQVLDENGAVHKPTVGSLIFSQPDMKKKVEAAIHPLVHRRFGEMAAELDGVIVYEATLLVESGNSKAFDLTISVEADDSRRLKWAVARGMTEDDAKARLAAQGDGNTRRQGVDRILRNDGELEDFHRDIDALINELRQIDTAKKAS